MVQALLIVGLVVSAFVAFLTLGYATQDWVRRVSRRR